jgi:hypothetical protein
MEKDLQGAITRNPVLQCLFMENEKKPPLAANLLDYIKPARRRSIHSAASNITTGTNHQ